MSLMDGNEFPSTDVLFSISLWVMVIEDTPRSRVYITFWRECWNVLER